jgi:hypothetical protein
MKVYHFTNSVFGISNIALRRLKLSRLNELNDPFEFLSADLLDPRYRATLLKFKNALHENHGMICFSSSWRNPLLWGHYADHHRGMALGFEIPDKFLFPVNYTSERFKVQFDQEKNEIQNANEVVEGLLSTKFRDWKYEQELRWFIPLSDKTPEAGIYFEHFSENLKLCEVVLGMKSELDLERFKTLFRNDLDSVRLKKAGMALRKFSIIEDRSARSALKSSK